MVLEILEAVRKSLIQYENNEIRQGVFSAGYGGGAVCAMNLMIVQDADRRNGLELAAFPYRLRSWTRVKAKTDRVTSVRSAILTGITSYLCVITC